MWDMLPDSDEVPIVLPTREWRPRMRLMPLHNSHTCLEATTENFQALFDFVADHRAKHGPVPGIDEGAPYGPEPVTPGSPTPKSTPRRPFLRNGSPSKQRWSSPGGTKHYWMKERGWRKLVLGPGTSGVRNRKTRSLVASEPKARGRKKRFRRHGPGQR